ncbi:MAG: hypothetical protein PHG96_09430 [Kiritimatiellae bacterium]|nr:hypothetical protein [Kiritimatiellia bacterium]
MIAVKALANKLAKACCFMMRDWTARLFRPAENQQTKQRRIRNMRLSQTRLLTERRHEKK